MKSDLKAIFEIVNVNLKMRYRQTLMGLLWVLLNPLILFFVQSILFTKIIRMGDHQNYSLYLLSGLLPWFFLTQTAEMGCSAVSGYGNIINNLKLHPFQLIIGLAVENFINYLLASSTVFVYIYLQHTITFTDILFFYINSAFLLLFVSVMTFLVAILNVLFKDTKFILHFLFTVLYFMTPTFYYPSLLPENIQSLIKLNPFFWLVSLFRLSGTMAENMLVIFVNLSIFCLISVLAFYIWKKYKNLVYLKI